MSSKIRSYSSREMKRVVIVIVTRYLVLALRGHGPHASYEHVDQCLRETIEVLKEKLRRLSCHCATQLLAHIKSRCQPFCAVDGYSAPVGCRSIRGFPCWSKTCAGQNLLDHRRYLQHSDGHHHNFRHSHEHAHGGTHTASYPISDTVANSRSYP